ncbi:MAG: S26 family signal peptidase, partial [Acidimicrobiales bacterium]|nr:S26 family signal peptidase [Acidimicrobiales bacterium]
MIDDDADEPKPSSRHSTPARPTNVRRTRPRPIQGWRAAGSKAQPPTDREAEGYYRTGKRGKPSPSWRARDSLYFAPLVALAIIVILLVGVYGYTQNWPPVYVVESISMQHGGSDQVGLINAGDLVLAQKIPVSHVVTYMVGMERGYSTYGEYGDVILYSPNGQGGTPVIHRPLAYLDWNATSATFSIPELQGLPCGSGPNASYSTSGTLGGCAWNDLPNGTVLNLYRIGWRSATVTVTLGSSMSGSHSGFLTMGDNNVDCSTSPCRGEPDQGPAAISQIVEPGWVIGVARGM